MLRSSDKKSGVDKFDAFKVLATESPSQLAYVFSEYENMAGHSIEKGIENEFSGDMKNLLLVRTFHISISLQFFHEFFSNHSLHHFPLRILFFNQEFRTAIVTLLWKLNKPHRVLKNLKIWLIFDP
ncbi:unnamed protein product [Heligmosomoides polygyrus]|uniref:Annexin n=1 Tax=Heligmosomoides polygyrus TaxID=6339 RepID=A0A183GSW2_HELPZ|nr:unnamed protein product [Heligmosomoides polygyrus]